jgi:hypothetical protein
MLKLTNKIKSENLNENLLKEFVSLTKEITLEQLSRMIRIDYPALKREIGKPKTLIELGGSIQKGGAYKKGTQNHSGHLGDADSYENSGKIYEIGYDKGKLSAQDKSNLDIRKEINHLDHEYDEHFLKLKLLQ